MGVLSFDKPYADRLFASVKDERFKPFAFRYDAVDQIDAMPRFFAYSLTSKETLCCAFVSTR